MVRNYFKITLRNIIRHKAFSIINISGLAIGIASCLLLFTVVKYELSYDTSQPNYKRIFHVVTQDNFSEGVNYNPGIPAAALDALRLQIPNVIFGCVDAAYGSQVTVNKPDGTSSDKKFIEESGLFFCDPKFFNIFKYIWLQGNENVLSEPNTVVLTKKTAEKYFGNWDQALNRTITLNNAVHLKVAGIIEDVPLNSDFPLGVIVSYETLKNNGHQFFYSNDWNTLSSNFQVFALLPPNVKAETVDAQLLSFGKDHYKDDRGYSRINFLQPLSQLHFDKRFEIFGNHITSRSTLVTLMLIGIFIMVMACNNFINLSTAQAVGRSKEIGIRKVLGSNRKQVFLQVMGETYMLVFLSILLAFAIAILCLPYIRHIDSIEESLSLFNLQTFVFAIILGVSITVLSGVYPAIIISGYKPALALKNKMSAATVGGISLRRALVVTQFTISQILIIGTIVAISQMNFVNNADLGFNKEAVYLLSGNSDSTMLARLPAFKEKLLHAPGVQSVTFSTDAPSSENTWSSNFAFNHKEDEKFQVSLKFADEDYFKTFALQFLAGRPYRKSDTTNEIVINETLTHKLGVPNANDIIGKDIRLGRSEWKKIVGVVKDFKTNSLRENIKPLLIAENKPFYGLTAVKINSSNLHQTQDNIQSAWNQYFPEYAFTGSFLDENIAKFYEQEKQLELLYKIFAGLAIFISCLGLYGLVSFMAVRRTKEIGVRKVLGASVGNIVLLFSKEFTILIAVAFVIAAPVAHFIMHAWLNNFVFRINMGVDVFLLAIFISVIIAWISVGYKAIKAALANPVKSLRVE
jgi:putative ABC transport system permease protein